MTLNLGRIGFSGDGDTSRFALNWLTLGFRNRKLEKAYAYNDIKKAVPLVRLTLAFGVFVYASFGILDYYLLDDVLYEVWLIRFGIVCPTVLAGVLSTRLPAFWKYAQKILGFCMMTAGLGIIAMTAIIPPPTNAIYYAGLMLVVIYGSTLVRMRFLNGAIIALIPVLVARNK